jgi:membrane protease YdiL (CAAX protease family)
LLLPAGLNVLSIVISNLLGRQSVQFSDLHDTNFTLVKMVTVTLFYQLFFYNLTGEEIGWRGFALPRLQSRLSPLIASLVLTFFWAAWHALYWKAAGEPVFSAQYWGETLIRLFPATVMINWFYNRSKGSILVAGIVHASANTAFAFMPRVDWPVHTVMMYIFVGGLVLISRMWEKLPIGHGAVVQITQEDPVLPGRIPAVMRNDGER